MNIIDWPKDFPKNFNEPIKISEMIYKLADIINKHGDINLYIVQGNYDHNKYWNAQNIKVLNNENNINVQIWIPPPESKKPMYTLKENGTLIKVEEDKPPPPFRL